VLELLEDDKKTRGELAAASGTTSGTLNCSRADLLRFSLFFESSYSALPRVWYHKVDREVQGVVMKVRTRATTTSMEKSLSSMIPACLPTLRTMSSTRLP
jgi:hypothetical protein